MNMKTDELDNAKSEVTGIDPVTGSQHDLTPNQIKAYEPTQGVSMVTIFSSYAPTEQVMYFLAENNIPFRVVLGSYQGDIETSFAIPTSLFPVVLAARWLTDRQICVMHIRSIQNTNERITHFEYLAEQDDAKRFEFMGNMEVVSKQVALAETGYTYDPVSQMYSIIHK